MTLQEYAVKWRKHYLENSALFRVTTLDTGETPKCKTSSCTPISKTAHALFQDTTRPHSIQTAFLSVTFMTGPTEIHGRD